MAQELKVVRTVNNYRNGEFLYYPACHQSRLLVKLTPSKAGAFTERHVNILKALGYSVTHAEIQI